MAGGLKGLIRHLHHEWTKNDGKLREGWAPGRDLKETVLIVALVICTGGLAVGTALLVLR